MDLCEKEQQKEERCEKEQQKRRKMCKTRSQTISSLSPQRPPLVLANAGEVSNKRLSLKRLDKQYQCTFRQYNRQYHHHHQTTSPRTTSRVDKFLLDKFQKGQVPHSCSRRAHRNRPTDIHTYPKCWQSISNRSIHIIKCILLNRAAEGHTEAL